METYSYPVTIEQVQAFDSDRITAMTEYLGALPVPIMVDAVTVDREPPQLRIRASADPTGALQAWVPTPSAGRNKLLQARSIAFAFRDKVTANPSAFTENDRATAAAITLIERLARMD